MYLNTRAGVRTHDDDAEGCGRLLGAGFLDEIQLVTSETGQPVDHGTRRLVHGLWWQVHGELHLAFRHITAKFVFKIFVDEFTTLNSVPVVREDFLQTTETLVAGHFLYGVCHFECESANHRQTDRLGMQNKLRFAVLGECRQKPKHTWTMDRLA